MANVVPNNSTASNTVSMTSTDVNAADVSVDRAEEIDFDNKDLYSIRPI